MTSGTASADIGEKSTADCPVTFDSSSKWERSAKIGLRSEPFGALAYHFDTRRLVFLKSPTLVDLVDGLVQGGREGRQLDGLRKGEGDGDLLDRVGAPQHHDVALDLCPPRLAAIRATVVVLSWVASESAPA